MKLFFTLTIALLVTSSVHAQCLGEAQLIAPIKSTQSTGFQGCKAFIDVNKVRFFASSRVCALSLSEIAASGIEVGLINGHDCRLETGDEISGVIVKKTHGVLVID